MAQVQNVVLAGVEDRAVVSEVLDVVGGAGSVLEAYLRERSVEHHFVEIVGRVVDDERRRAGKIHVCPGVGKNVHRDAGCLEAPAFRELDSSFKKLTVRTADKAVLVLIGLGRARSHRFEVFGQEME